ncbi:alpha- and gamma-adaptin-binding protein p34-like [Lycorma delicatula]|uniref:alpha- and gamma-adaptin-binding protein p34-like n=1 Tax=Lycorma delicatula TaxID=130591 RepID=UPI003F5130BA
MNPSSISQSALFVSSASKHPDEIIKLIIGDGICNTPYHIEDGVSIAAYPWHVNTKYYVADIHLCSMAGKGLAPQHFASTVQAIVFYFDSNQSNGLETAEGWLPFLNEYDAEVKIMLCNRCHEKPVDGITKLSAQEWCVKKGFELVELDPEVDDEWEAEQDFVETTGIKRVIQALHAHVWPVLTMKDRKEPTSFNGLLHGGLTCSDDNNLSEELEDLHLGTGLDQANIEGKIEELFGGGDLSEGDMDFSTLFGQLQEMKERVSSLSNDQRKACAEQVVLAFWKAIGGDNEEIDMPEDG